MRIVITGSAGFIGTRLAKRLLRRDDVERLVLFDVRTLDDALAADARVEQTEGDIADPAAVARAIAPGTDSVFHFSAVVSAGAEADFDLGMRVNLDGTWRVLEACRRLPNQPRLIFASSEAVYGARTGPVIDDDTPLYPQTSYGAHKACSELLVSDYSRKGFLDGRSLRFPTVVVRPEPNLAASTFTSSIVREPLAGRDVVCPVSPQSRMTIMSVRRLLECIERAHDLPPAAFGAERALLLPALGVTVADIVEGVRRAGGEAAAERIHFEPDPAIQRIVDTWPRDVKAARAEALGLLPERSVDEIIATFVEDDLTAGGRAFRS